MVEQLDRQGGGEGMDRDPSDLKIEFKLVVSTMVTRQKE